MRVFHIHQPVEAAMTAALSVVCLLAVLGHALPLDPRAGRQGGRVPDMPNLPDMNTDQSRRPRRIPDTPGLDPEEYNRYWEEMARDNPALQEHLQRMKPEDLAKLHPRMSERMARDSDEIRNRLEEARRMNMDEMRELQRLQMMQERDRRMAPDSEWIARQQAMRDNLPLNYNTEDIQRRVDEQRRVLEDIDRKRREDFSRYEMQIEHQRREKLKAMDEHQRLKAEQELRQRREQQMHHEKLNKPASKQQLEEVWENNDGLKDEAFDPKTFFFLHDTNGDRNLDPMELEALFRNEVRKAYGKDSDTMQSHEEMARMREFAMKQLDQNHDSIISLKEFLGYTQGNQFEENEEWKPVVDKEEEAFTEEEMERFEDDYYEDYYDYEYDEKGNIIGFKTKPKSPSNQPPVSQQPPAPEGDIEAKGDAGAANAEPSPPVPPANEGERGAQPNQQEQQEEQRQQQQQQQQEQQQQDEGMPYQPELHVQPAGTQKEGQAQQFQKDPGADHGRPGQQ